MNRKTFKAPLFAAFFCAVVLSSCTKAPPPTAELFSGQATAIAEVQGDDGKSPLLGRAVTVQGTVTLTRQGEGLYLEQENSDADPGTSNAVYIQSAELPTGIAEGSHVAVRGTVTELGDGGDTQTALMNIEAISRCGTAPSLPLTGIDLPLNAAEREALEGMRISINAPLAVTDVYQYGLGNVTLSGNGMQYVATEVMQPGPKAAAYLAGNRASALPVHIPVDRRPPLLVSGAAVDGLIGVLGHDQRGKRVFLQDLAATDATAFPAPLPAPPGALRIVGMNLHNYFNGDGKGSGFPTPRGAESSREFDLQRQRIAAAIRALDPDVLAVQELENDGFGDYSAAQDLIRLAHDATGKTWRVTRPAGDDTGDDAITVGIFYDADKLQASGPSQTLKGREFEASRQPQAQLFVRSDNGEKLLVVVNHLKSKGSCPESGENSDQRDGQGCWNPVRRASAEKMSAWAKALATSAGTANILVLGDMNAYRNEDPIAAIRDHGFSELIEMNSAGPRHSFAFRGQHGTLDYAFGSGALLGNVQQAFIWHVNATLPVRMELPAPWLRFSDHDPVVVDLR
jgi:predicted extracellular nuclease